LSLFIFYLLSPANCIWVAIKTGQGHYVKAFTTSATWWSNSN